MQKSEVCSRDSLSHCFAIKALDSPFFATIPSRTYRPFQDRPFQENADKKWEAEKARNGLDLGSPSMSIEALCLDKVL